MRSVRKAHHLGAMLLGPRNSGLLRRPALTRTGARDLVPNRTRSALALSRPLPPDGIRSRSTESSLPDASASPSDLVHAYRAVIRCCPASVRFSKPAAKNLRRLLRDEFQSHLTGRGHGGDAHRPFLPSQLEVKGYRERTMALLLASARSPRRRLLSQPVTEGGDSAVEAATTATAPTTVTVTPTRSNDPSTSQPTPPRWGKLYTTLPHRLISNLSSLTYHHLSPHTRMQPLTTRPARTEPKPKPLTALARLLQRSDHLDPDAPASTGIVNAPADRLAFLRVAPKPLRGPKRSKLPVWDAQNGDKMLGLAPPRPADPSAPPSRDLQRITERIGRGGAREQGGVTEAVRELERRERVVGRQRARREREEAVQRVPVGMLVEVVASAQACERVWLGSRRFETRGRGGWLTP